MKRILMTILLMAAVPAAWSDSYFYWMLEEDGGSNVFGTDFVYAKIRVDGTTDYLALGMFDGEWGEAVFANGVEGEGDTGTSIDDCWANLGVNVGDDSSFVLELYQDGDVNPRASSRPVRYADLEAAGFTWKSGDDPLTRPFSGWIAAPEPTSGLLVLLGLAVFGLKRRRGPGSEDVLT